MDWTNPRVGESVEEEEPEMSSLVSSFSARMRKQAAREGETPPSAEASGGKRPKLTGPNEEAQKSPEVINVDSLDRAFVAQSSLEGGPQDAPRKAYAPSDDGILAGGSPNAEGVVAKASLKVVAAPSFLTRLASSDPHRPRMSDRLLLSSYIPPQEWVPHLGDTVALGQEGAQEIIDRWSPFKKRESLVTHMYKHLSHPSPSVSGGSC